MNARMTRVRSFAIKELREYRRNGFIVATMALIPLGIVIFPVLLVINLPASDANAIGGDPLLILLGIPALAPSVITAYTVVGERAQGTLEPVLTTPIRREELLLAKALAALVPTLGIAYAMYLLFVAITKFFAQPAVASAVLQGPDLLVQVLFTPLLATWSIWVGIAVSTRASDVRVAQQVGGAIAGLPAILVAYLTAFNVIHASVGLTLGAAAVLLILDFLGWRIVAAAFDRERLVTGSR